MAFIAGFATKTEIAELTRRGWEVEPAEKYNLVGDGEGFLMEEPTHEAPEETQAVVVWVDSSMFDIMSGPDWDK